MTYQGRHRCRRHAVASTAVLATIATAVSFLGPITSRAAADSTSTTSSTTSTTAVPGSNCSATLNGSALNRSGWAASTNAASSSADAPAKAIDGNYSTRFSTGEHQAAGLYFEVNMGSAQSFNELKMSSPNSPNDYARGFDVEVSKDGNSWTTVASCTGTRTPETVSFPDQSEQYVKVVLSTGTATTGGRSTSSTCTARPLRRLRRRPPLPARRPPRPCRVPIALRSSTGPPLTAPVGRPARTHLPVVLTQYLTP